MTDAIKLQEYNILNFCSLKDHRVIHLSDGRRAWRRHVSVAGVRTGAGSTHSILYKVASLKWSKNAHGALANLIQESQNVYVDLLASGNIITG